MNKEQAAATLGITVRTLQRHMAAHRIGFAMRKTATGEEATFSAEEVARFKAQRDALTETVTPAANVSEVVGAPSQALERAGGEQGMQAFASMIADALQAREAQGNGIPAVPLRDKMTLSFKEASRLSGVPESHLRTAYADGALRGAKIGRGVRVTQDDVRKYVEGRMKAKKRG
jgi:excisionase family DNA binding protein